MRILRGVYEGPASHGVLRVAASLENVQAVLRGAPSEGYFPAYYGERKRDGAPAPVTLSPLYKRPEDTSSPGDLGKDVAGVVRDAPEAEAVIITRSETALLTGEGPPEVSLPEAPSPETSESRTPESRTPESRPPVVIPCGWETPEIRETEAAELALEDFVQAGVERRARSLKPSVNLFGPPVLGPGAAAEYQEVERLLTLLGVEVNARVPLGVSPSGLRSLSGAWANVVLYREIAESATLYLQDEFGMPRVMTPMVGTVGTGAAIKNIGRLCEIERERVRRVIWSELSRTARLPWFARLAPPETFEGRRVFIFGDFTYALGLGHTLTREVGLEVPYCGTYLSHLARDFTFHAETFAEDAFVADDPDEVAARIEESSPDLVIGTHLERDVAESLNIPFLGLCPPVEEHPFAERPLMGYTGSSVLADALEVALRRVEDPGVSSGRPGKLPWSAEALEELEEVPPFLRGRARRLAEDRARQDGASEVNREIFLSSRL